MIRFGSSGIVTSCPAASFSVAVSAEEDDLVLLELAEQALNAVKLTRVQDSQKSVFMVRFFIRFLLIG